MKHVLNILKSLIESILSLNCISINDNNFNFAINIYNIDNDTYELYSMFTFIGSSASRFLNYICNINIDLSNKQHFSRDDTTSFYIKNHKFNKNQMLIAY